MILVMGATRNVGSQVVRELREKGTTLRAFVRDPAKAAGVLGNNIELAVGDFSDAASVRRALEVKNLNQTSDIALTTGNWHLTGTGPDGNPVDMRGQSVEVSRRQSDGTWRFVIDNPFGLGWDG